MSLTMTSLLVSLGIAFFSLLPWYLPGVRSYSRSLLAAGTVILLAVCAFDLLPEMIELGGGASVALMAASWAFFSGFHALKSRGHAAHEPHEHGITFLLASMTLHCFAGGMMLVSSYEISARLASSVFLGLIAHKGFEAISVSSLLMEKVPSRARLVRYVAIYALAFPAGAVLTVVVKTAFSDWLHGGRIETVAMVITSVAVGSLLGCLLQDFLLPSLREIRATAVKLTRAFTA